MKRKVVLDYDLRPEYEKAKLSEIERYEELLHNCSTQYQKIETVNDIANEFSEKCHTLAKIIEGNLLKESMRRKNDYQQGINKQD
ncbi:hypothetical protein CMI44_00560 [Candidatus Pacearchaeota archaeon]|jgi:hypothetical protein|nr:hypothetical protein [Candidatus Pacearchaeota archaeon]|tara:strand:- start:1777 stop:2031 length:255 start_codon:yes stop_codon:yes gene_type:complete